MKEHTWDDMPDIEIYEHGRLDLVRDCTICGVRQRRSRNSWAYILPSPIFDMNFDASDCETMMVAIILTA